MTQTSGNSNCPTCGAKTVEYKHSLGAILVHGLIKLQQAGGGPIHLREVGLSHSEWDNFQKLRYFGLAVRAEPTGHWQVTTEGLLFLRGHSRVPKAVWTYRGYPVRTEGELVNVYDVVGDFDIAQREDYAREARPHL